MTSSKIIARHALPAHALLFVAVMADTVNSYSTAVNLNYQPLEFAMTMHKSSVNTAIDAALSQFASSEKASAYASVVAALKSAQQANRDKQGALFAGLLALAAEGAPGSVIRATGNAISVAITRILRVNAGFPAVKAQGTKESGAPTFSTAKVYAGHIAGSLDWKAQHPNIFAVALADTINETEAPRATLDCGYLFPSVSAHMALNAKCLTLYEAEQRAQYPALYPQQPASLQQQLAQAHAEAQALRDEVQAHKLALANATASAKADAERADKACAEALTLRDEVDAYKLALDGAKVDVAAEKVPA
jgi:hypothetical protein